MDEPVPIEGIVEGEPESLAAVCAAGGSAVLAYCSAVGAWADLADTVVTALATFRRGVVEHADQDPSQLEELLLACTADAARRLAGVDPTPVQQAAAEVALESAVTSPLAPGLASRIIRALVEAAPVTALDGDPAAVRRAAEQHYARVFDGPQARAAPPAPAPAPTAPAAAAGQSSWVPSEVADVDVEAVNARAVRPRAERRSAAPGPPAVAPEDLHAPLLPPPPNAPLAPPAPGALVIKRGGHWPFRRSRKPGGGGRGRGGRGANATRNALIAGMAGLALGAGVAFLATAEKEVARDAVLVRALDTPFTVQGAVFNIARTNQAGWAVAIRRRPLRPGRTWLTLAAQTRNIDRANFLPRSLDYRVRTATGIVIGPDTAQISADVAAARGRQAPGERASVHLGFQIPSGQPGLTLEFDPVPRRGPRIRVPLS